MNKLHAKGVGNGISIIIFAGIVAGIPTMQLIKFMHNNLKMLVINYSFEYHYGIANCYCYYCNYCWCYLCPTSITKNSDSVCKTCCWLDVHPVGGQSTHLPLKVNAAGVIPVIFAVSFIVTPRTIASFFEQNDVTLWIQKIFDYTHPIGMIIYAALIIAFTYFYAFIQVNPEQVAENLKKQGGYIPGIRPGINTQEYLTRTLYRLTFVGAIFLTVIAILPVFFSKVADLPQSAQIGGTSLTDRCWGCP